MTNEGRAGADPVLAALAQKGWAFRAKPSGAIKSVFKPNLIARRSSPLDRPRIARRRAAGDLTRRAPLPFEDLSAPLAALAPNLAVAAAVFLFLLLIL